MAAFLEVLAETGIIAHACRAVGMSRDSAYALRDRDPVFAAALRAAQVKARPVVADGLLERSINGTVEHYYRNGVLVGERRHYESWLGRAMLKRLDRQAEEDRAEDGLAARVGGEWQAVLEAMRSGGTAAARDALDAKTDKTDKADTPPSPPGYDPSHNIWEAGSAEDPKPGRAHPVPDGTRMTCFPPPPGFEGYQNVPWDGDAWYERECTAEENALLDAHQAAIEAEEQAEATAYAESQRDDFFENLRTELARLDPAGKPAAGKDHSPGAAGAADECNAPRSAPRAEPQLPSGSRTSIISSAPRALPAKPRPPASPSDQPCSPPTR